MLTLLSSRRGRPLFFVALAILTLALFFNRRKIANYLGLKPRVNEIYGLLYFVTRGSEQRYTLSDAADIDPAKSIDFSVYSGGKRWIDWRAEAQRINKEFPIILFSKTNCHYSNSTKLLFSVYNVRPEPYIVELDRRGDGALIKALLTRMTGRETIPNIIVGGRSMGGATELYSLDRSNKLEKILDGAGVSNTRFPLK